MKKTFKGFTLVECIVALAVLGVASLTMAQIYARVAARNRENHLVNTSLANQVAYVEKYSTDIAEMVKLEFSDTIANTTTPPHESGTANSYYVMIESNYKADANVYEYDIYNNNKYSYGVDLYILKSRDSANKVYEDPAGTPSAGNVGYEELKENPNNLRYKYLTGHVN